MSQIKEAVSCGLLHERPRAIGCDISYLELSFEENWHVSLARLASLVRPNTRLISLTCPHNPSGAVFDEATLRGAIALAERHGCRLLVDETYREMTFGTPLPSAAACSNTAPFARYLTGSLPSEARYPDDTGPMGPRPASPCAASR